MRILKALFLTLLLSFSSFTNAAAHCTECDKTSNLCICLIPEYVGIFHWNFDHAYFDIAFNINGTTHHYNSNRELHKDVLDSIDIALLKDAKVSNIHYELKTIDNAPAENCVIDLDKPKTGMFLVTIKKQAFSFVCDIQFTS